MIFKTTPATAMPADLVRIKVIATSLLAGCFCLYLVSKGLAPTYPVFGFVAAFAEAATIGGLADWYAVVSLFRHPLNLPIPHTAIIPRNQATIGDKIGEFIEVHFLDRGPVDAKLAQIDFALLMADWLKGARRSTALAGFLIRLLPDSMRAAEASGIRRMMQEKLADELAALDVRPLAAAALRAFAEQGRHRVLLDRLLRLLEETLERPEIAATIRDKVKAEIPSLLKLYRADGFLSRRILEAAATFLAEVRHDADHPLRREFDAVVASFADRLETDPGYAHTLTNLKEAALGHHELGALLDAMWAKAKAYVAAAAGSDHSVLQGEIARLMMEFGSTLEADPRMRAEINSAILAVLTGFVAREKKSISTFVSDQVKSWDMSQLIGLIEANIGKDLQYIRLNGTIIGGTIGVVLHAIELLIGFYQ